MQENLWYYKLLDFPSLPDHLVRRLDQLIQEQLLGLPDQVYTPTQPGADGAVNYIQYKNFDHSKHGQIIYHELPKEFIEWIEHNITDTYERVKFSVHHGEIAPPHTDLLRQFGINYIHQLGGDQVKTVWYQEIGKPVVRDMAQEGRVRQPDYAKLTVLDQVVLPAHQWHVLRTDILHSVENLQHNRIRIAIDLSKEAVMSLANHFI
jgi:hypothetical protein